MWVRDERDHDRVLPGILERVDTLGENLPDLAHVLRRDPHRHLRAAELPERAELRPCTSLVAPGDVSSSGATRIVFATAR